MGQLDKFIDGLRIQGVAVGLIVKPGIGGGILHIGVPADGA